MGIDFGAKRVGIALSDEDGKFALPKAVLPNDRTLFREVRDLCRGHKVEVIVMGESKNFEGGDNLIMKEVNRFKAELERDLKLPVFLEPEFLTSAEAERIQGKTAMHDASAAALILKSYLDKHDKF